MAEPHERLRQARIEAGFKTAADFARVFGIEPGTYNHHETGVRGFARIARRYARALNVSVEWLLGQPDASPNDPAQMAAELARRMTPEQRAAWFSVGSALAQSADRDQAGNDT